MSEFKEFWIYHNLRLEGYSDVYDSPIFLESDAKGIEPVHVIEYKAYSKLKEENELLRAAFKREITKLSDINASDYDKYEQEITDLKQEIDRLNNYTISGLEIMLAELKHDHKIMLEALKISALGETQFDGVEAMHSARKAISQLKHKENI